jgi:hypothetical protein
MLSGTLLIIEKGKMKLTDEDAQWARKQTKSRHRPRATSFLDGLDKINSRQAKRQNEKQIIDEALEDEEDALIDPEDFDEYEY